MPDERQLASAQYSGTYDNYLGRPLPLGLHVFFRRDLPLYVLIMWMIITGRRDK